MRRIGIAIATAAALLINTAPIAALAQGKAAAPPPISKAQRDQGMKEAPAVVQAARAPCVVTDAYWINTTTDAKTKAKTSFYEVACQQGMGYVVQSAPDSAKAFDCLAINDQAKAQPGALTCRLPANMDPKMALAPILTSAGHTCTPTDARAMGSTASGASFYEVACQGGKGYVIQTPAPGSTDKVKADDCIQFLGGQTECKLTTKEQILAGMNQLAASSGKPCTVSNARFVGGTATSNYYEVACGAQPGYIIEANANTGAFASAIDCAKAQGIAGGCSLTVVDETAEAGTYTKLAQGAGFPCTVSKYRYLGKETKSNSEIVELACSDHANGGIGMFPISGGKSQVFDCVQGASLGVSCQLTQASAVYDKYTQGLASKGKNTCKVSGAKYLASTNAGADLIETACSDGLPGWVMAVNHTSGAVTDLMTCGEAGRAGATCSLPTNVKK